MKTATNEVAAGAGFLVVGTGHAQGQLHSTRTPADPMWSTSNKTEQRSWEVGGQSTRAICLHVTRRNSADLNEKGEVNLWQSWSDLDSNYPLVGT